ncbi:hypothetical protein BVY03_04235 [bacterium K02(2017)]|nr:hypothetical protein BVY03_04235 [bacterium K02(2017)]
MGEVDDNLKKIMQKLHLDNEFQSAAIFRKMLGFKPDDPRVIIWDAITDSPDNLGPADQFDYFLLTGSAHMVDSGLPWIKTTEDFLKKLIDAEVPGLATCFGFQLLCHAYGAQVGRKPETPYKPEFGTATLNYSELAFEIPLLDGVFDRSLNVFNSSNHEQVILTPPLYAGAKILFADEYWPNKGMVFPLGNLSPAEAFRQGKVVLGLQDHIEKSPFGLELARQAEASYYRDFDIPIDKMVFRDNPEVRKIFLNILKQLAPASSIWT